MPVKTKTKKSAAKHHGGLTMIPLRSWVAFWFFVLVTMTLIIVCFTNAFRSIDGEANRETAAAFQTIRQNLEAQVAELQGRVTATTNTASAECTSVTSTRIDSYLTYVDPNTSVNVRLPFSTGWTNNTCDFAPVKFIEGSMVFGPMSNGERDSSFSVRVERLSLKDIKQKMAPGYPGATEDTVASIRERTINGIPVLSFETDDGGMVWYAFGKNYTYILDTSGWLTDAEAIKIIQSLKVVK